jgi:hypothetical protein
MEKFLSGINIPDPQHCSLLSRTFSEMVKAQTLSHGTLVKILFVVCAIEIRIRKNHVIKVFITYHS